MKLFYNTNGFAHHRLEDVVSILVELGYDGIALTPDVNHLDPCVTTDAEYRRFGDLCEAAGLEITIESGARFVLDPRRKHEPNLVSTSGHERRAAYYERLIAIAEIVGSKAISIWSGATEEGGCATMRQLAERLDPVLECAVAHGITVSFEPEPGMFVERLEQYDALVAELPSGRRLGLTIDVGHLVVNESAPYERHLSARAEPLTVVHLDDACRGIHEHRMIGDGEIEWPTLAATLRAIEFSGPLVVELSRHSHDAVRAARAAIEKLRSHGF